MKSFSAAVQAALSLDGSVQVTSQLVAPAPPWWKVMTPSAWYLPPEGVPSPLMPGGSWKLTTPLLPGVTLSAAGLAGHCWPRELLSSAAARVNRGHACVSAQV